MSKTVLFGSAAAYTTAANPSLLATGEIGVYSIAVDGTYTLLTTTPSAAQKLLPIMVAQGGVTGGNFRNVIIYPNGIVSAPTAATSYVAPIPDVAIAGYYGTGSTDTIQSGVAGTYNLTVTNTTQGTIPLPYNLASTYYTLAATATAFQVAYDWAKTINTKTINAYLKPYDRFVVASVLTDATSAQLVTSGPANITGTVTNGSTAVTLSGSTAGGTTVLTAGSYIRIGHATLVTYPVYKIASMVSATSVVLDSPYVNESLAIGASVATVALGKVTAPTSSNLGGIRCASFGNWFDGSTFVEARANNSIAIGVSGSAIGTVMITNRVTAQTYLAATALVTTGVHTLGYGTGPQAQKQEFEATAYMSANTNRSWLAYPVQLFAAGTSNYDGYTVIYASTPFDASNTGFARTERHSLQLFCITPSTDSGDTLASAKVPAILSGYINA